MRRDVDKLHKLCHAYHGIVGAAAARLFDSCIDDLQSRKNEMRRTYLILRKSSKSPYHAATMDKRAACRTYPAMAY